MAELSLRRDRLLMRGAIPLFELLALDGLFKFCIFGLKSHEIVDGGFEHELSITPFGRDGLLIHCKLLALIGVHPRQALQRLTQLLTDLANLLPMCLTADRVGWKFNLAEHSFPALLYLAEVELFIDLDPFPQVLHERERHLKRCKHLGQELLIVQITQIGHELGLKLLFGFLITDSI